MIKKALVALAAIPVMTLAACGGGPTGGQGDSNTLNIYVWAGEMPASVAAAFTKETGIKVRVDTFDSNETMIAKLAAGNSGYDLVEPSQYAVQQLAGQQLVETLDHSRIQGIENLSTNFVNASYDPVNKYSVPWVWGTTGLLYNEKCTGKPVDSWQTFFDPAYKGRIYMLDNMLAAYIVGLQVLGYHADSKDKGQIEEATHKLQEQKPLLAGYNSTNYADLVSQGQACLAEAWSGTSTGKAVDSNPDVKYVVPKEGGSIWTDSFSIAKGAAHADAAYRFISFSLRPDVAAMATDDGSMASANEAARAKITNKRLLENPAIYAPANSLGNADFIVDPGQAMTYYQQGWTKVKSS